MNQLERRVAEAEQRSAALPAPKPGEPANALAEVRDDAGEITGWIELFWSPTAGWVSVLGVSMFIPA